MTATPQTPADNSKELNFRAQEKAMRDHYEGKLAAERAERERIARELDQARRMKDEEEEVDPEPYVDHKKLEKKLNKYGQQQQQKTQSEIERAMQTVREEAKREAWLENHSDFEDIIINNADKLAKKSPKLTNSILAMPDTFERRKLVYETIKEMGLHKPEEKQSTIQEKIQANQRGQFYQPSNVASAPYQGQTSDFSKSGQEAAYKKMKDLISNVRL